MDNKVIIDKINKLIQDNHFNGWQVFNTMNFVGDEMSTVFEEGDVSVLACYDCGYLEIFGVSVDDLNKLKDVIIEC